MRKVPLAPDVNAKVIARGTPGFSGADLANLVNEAALLAARKGRRAVTMPELEEAKDKVMMGSERRSLVMTEEEKALTAYHEAGHALVGYHIPGNDPLHKITIIPRGRALGLTMWLPERDRYGHTKQELESRMARAYGGRVAEELIYGPDKVTTGASSDIKQATEIARAMVTEYGMSEALGPLRYNENQEEVFLGHSVSQQKNVSDATAKLIDDEVRRLIGEADQTARTVLTEHIDDLHTIAKALLEYETINGEEMECLLKGHPIIRTERPEEPTKPRSGSRSSVPSSGGAGSGAGGGIEPEPQPGG
jgi:cell division protease FtsH